MADEETTAGPAQKAKGGLFRKLGVYLGVVMVAAILGLTTYKWVVAPMFEESPGGEELDKIPPTAVTVQFDECRVDAIMTDPNALSSLLIYQVALECANDKTRALVEAHKARFNEMINSLHQFRNREDLKESYTKDDIQRRILEEANIILKRLQEKPDPEVRVTAVFHPNWAVIDQ